MKVPSESGDKLAELQSSLAREKLRPAVLEAISRPDLEIKRKLVRTQAAPPPRVRAESRYTAPSAALLVVRSSRAEPESRPLWY
jgi:hypothetical protein